MIAPAFVSVISFQASHNTNVYAVPVCAFISSQVVFLVVVNVCAAVNVLDTSFFVVSTSYPCTETPMSAVSSMSLSVLKFSGVTVVHPPSQSPMISLLAGVSQARSSRCASHACIVDPISPLCNALSAKSSDVLTLVSSFVSSIDQAIMLAVMS